MKNRWDWVEIYPPKTAKWYLARNAIVSTTWKKYKNQPESSGTEISEIFNLLPPGSMVSS